MVCWIITVDILYCVLSEVVVLKTHLSWKTRSRNRARRHSCFIHVLCLRTKWISCCFEHVFSIFGGTNDKTPRDDGILKQTIVSDLNKTGLHEKTAYFALYYTISQIAV